MDLNGNGGVRSLSGRSPWLVSPQRRDNMLTIRELSILIEAVGTLIAEYGVTREREELEVRLRDARERLLDERRGTE